MKFTRIAVAIASTCGALASTSAFAVTADQYTNSGEITGSTLNIRISGASAQDNGILGSALSLCVAGTVHRYAISNNFVFYCTPDVGSNPGQILLPARTAANGGPVNKLAIYKYSIGGSGLGVTPINSTNATTDGSGSGDGARLPFLDLTKITSQCTGTNAVLSNPTFGPGTSGSYNNVSCGNASSALTTAAVSYVGVSDMEPAFFSNKTSNINSLSNTALIFGPIVTKNVYDRLQVLQSLSVPSCGATLDSEGCMPSLSSAQLVSLYTQSPTSWSAIGVTGLANDSVYVARRVNSSGTQKTFEAVIAHTPNGDSLFKSCLSGVEQFVQPDSGTLLGDANALCTVSTTNPTVPTIFAGAGGSNVQACLTNHQAQSRSAIGILTTEDKPNASWRFVKVDGVAPNQANNASGRYRFYTEAALHTRIGGAIATAGAEGYTAFVARLGTDLANKTIIKQVNGSDQSFGSAGLMALLSRQTAAPDNVADFTGANSIIPWSKLVGGTTVDNCQAPKAVF